MTTPSNPADLLTLHDLRRTGWQAGSRDALPGLGFETYAVTVHVPGDGTVTITDVRVPEPLDRVVEREPFFAWPFVIDALRRATSSDADALLRDVRELAASFAVVEGAHGLSLDDVRSELRDVAEARADAITGNRRAADVLASHLDVLDADEYDLDAAIDELFKAGTAAAVALLHRLRFDLRATKTADHYGDRSVSVGTAHLGNRSVDVRVTAGIHQPGAFQAAHHVVAELHDGDPDFEELFTPSERAVLEAFTWPKR